MMFQFNIPTHAVFGTGQLNHLHEYTLPGKKALIITSNGKSTKENGYLARTEEQLKKAGVSFLLYDKIEANPLRGTVTDGGRVAGAGNVDFLVALGGGSVLDAAKGIAVVATNGGDVWDYITNGTGGNKKITHTPLPIVAIPTTSGTGSETDAGGVITNPDTQEKTPIKDVSLFPKLAIIDPELTLTVPPRFTAYQGFDALFHNIEGYLSNKSNAMSEIVATEAITRIASYLPKAVADGKDIEARASVAFASYLGGIEMVLSSTVSHHSLEHSLSSFHQELPHGAGLIMLSHAYFSHLIHTHEMDDRFITLAQLLGNKNATKPEDFLTALEALKEACSVQDLHMKDYHILPDEFPKMAHIAKSAMAFLFTNDRVTLSEDDCIAIYNDAYHQGEN